jgi:hypothetical protein
MSANSCLRTLPFALPIQLSLAKMLSGANAFRISGHKLKAEGQYATMLHARRRAKQQFAAHSHNPHMLLNPQRA